MSKKYTKNDFEKRSWEEYAKIMEKILKDVQKYITKNKIKIDAVVPILRGGNILGTFLAYRLHLLRILPVQYKYFFIGKNEAELRQILFTIKKDMFKDNPTFLLVEGDQCFGNTVITAVKDIKKIFPKAKILHVADCLDYSYRNSVKDYVEKIFYGEYTNHCEELSAEKCKELGIGKASMAPWENYEEEIATVSGKQFQYGDGKIVEKQSIKKQEFKF
ncbi:MAG: phosphoribosyltransferase [bacterium]|nr:phosphoribosyltransferase [bacterium]